MRSARQTTGARANEYFVPREGINREVIQADICRYLGNDALVRPGQVEDPDTHQLQQVWVITAYRNLTSAMIEDLRLDSQRWERERLIAAARPTSYNGDYRRSTTHEQRQAYGPSETSAPMQPIPYSQPPQNNPQGAYEHGGQQSQLPSSYQPPQQYFSPPQDYQHAPFVPIGDMAIDPQGTGSSGGRPPMPQTSTAPRQQYQSQPPNYPQQDRNSPYYPQPGMNQTTQSQYSQPQVAEQQVFRAAHPGYEPNPEVYGRGSYQEMDYSQPQPTGGQTATSGIRREHERDQSERERVSRVRR